MDTAFGEYLKAVNININDVYKNAVYIVYIVHGSTNCMGVGQILRSQGETDLSSIMFKVIITPT